MTTKRLNLIVKLMGKGILIVAFALLFVTFTTSSVSAMDETPAEYSIEIQPVSATSCETRGVWINPGAFDTVKERYQTMNKIIKANLNTVFVLAPPVGIYNGWADPVMFKAFTQALKSRGLSVHIWVANMFRVDEEGWRADFTDPNEQNEQVKWALALLKRYPYLDGIHFDYIRYEVWDETDIAKVEGISETIRKTHNAIQANYPDKLLTAAVYRQTPNYINFNVDDVPVWFRDWYEQNPDNYFETALDDRDSAPQFFKYQQDPVSWVNDGNIDSIIPMQYMIENTEWNAAAKQWKAFLTMDDYNLKKVFLGLGWYLPEHVEKPWHIVQKIKYARTIGIRGFVIFQFGGRLDGELINDYRLINALTVDSNLNNYAAPFSEPARTCLVP